MTRVLSGIQPTGDIQVQVLHALELGQVAVDDAAQRDLVDVDLLARDQMQEQVERSLEDGGADLVRHRHEATEGVPGRRVPLQT